MNLGIILLTYNRPERAIATLKALYDYAVVGPDDKVFVHIADDGSPEPQRRDIVQFAAQYFPTYWGFGGLSSSDAERRGYGASYNLATQALHDVVDYVLVMEDDWALKPGLHLSNWMDVIDCHLEVNSIRFGYIGFTDTLRGRLVGLSDNPHMLGILFDPDSPEKHVNAGHPRLERVSYQRAIGPWREGVLPGEVELDWCGREAARKGVVYPLWDSHGPFAHTGDVKAEDTVDATPVLGPDEIKLAELWAENDKRLNQ